MKYTTLTKTKILNKIEDNKAELRKYDVKNIGLFGSYLKNTQKPRSDIDFLVQFKTIQFKNYINLLSLLQKIFNKKIDLVIKEDLKPELNYIKKEVVYAKI